MTPMAESLLFIQALLAHVDRLQELLGNQWPAFEAKLQQLLTQLDQAQSDDQALFMVDEIFDLGLNSPAAELVRSLFNQAATEAGTLDSTTRSVPMTDPTSGETREVEVRPAEASVAKGLTVYREEVMAAGQQLVQALQREQPRGLEMYSANGGDTPASALSLPTVPKVKTHANLQSPDYAYLGQVYSLTVKLSDQPQQAGPHRSVPEVEIPVEPGEVSKKIGVKLDAPDFDLAPTDQALGWLREINFYVEARASGSVTFNLLAQDRFEPRYFTTLRVQYQWQGEVIGTAACRVEVLQDETIEPTPLPGFPKAPGFPLDERGKVRLPGTVNTPVSFAEQEALVHLTITIDEDSVDRSKLRWLFASATLPAVDFPAGSSPNLGAQEFVKTYLAPFGMPGHWSNPHMDDHGQLKSGSIPTLLGNLIQLRKHAPPEFWTAYQQVLQAHQSQGHSPDTLTLLFRTSDTHIPWELMPVSEEVRDGKMPLLLGNAHRVGRWLVGLETPVPEMELALKGFALAAPTYSQRPLPEAQAERQFLQQHYQPYPIVETPEVFRTFMLDGQPTGGAGILHFAGHGDCCTDEIRGNWLVLSDSGDGDWYDIHAASNDLGNRLGKLGRDVLAFFNACNVGRAAPGPLGSNGGWGRALLQQQYKGYIGPLWSVYDQHARDVAQTFYTLALEQNLPLGEAMRQIRAKFAEDNRLFTYLAYLYLGHPLAKINYIKVEGATG